MGTDGRAEGLARHQLHWTLKLVFQKKRNGHKVVERLLFRHKLDQ